MGRKQSDHWSLAEGPRAWPEIEGQHGVSWRGMQTSKTRRRMDPKERIWTRVGEG